MRSIARTCRCPDVQARAWRRRTKDRQTSPAPLPARGLAKRLWNGGLPSFWEVRFTREPESKRATGIEPAWPAWKAGTLPLSYARAGSKLPRRGSNANSFFGRSLNQCQFFSASCDLELECTGGKTQFVRSRGLGIAGHLFVESVRDKCGVVATKTERVT